MLQLTGEVRRVDTETVNGPTGSFESTTFHVLSDVNVYRVRAARDFRAQDWPREGETVSLEISVSAYSGRNGAGVQMTALRRAKAQSGPVGIAPSPAHKVG